MMRGIRYILKVVSYRLSVIGYQMYTSPITDYRSLILALFLWTNSSQSQQLPLYTQFMINDYIINPAIGGKNPYYEAKSSNRYQWVGIEDAPRTYILSFNGPIKAKHVGLG